MNGKMTFFSLLDLSREGLESVKANVEKNDFNGAATALLEYYRSRDHVNYYDGWEVRPLGEAFDTTKADQICNNHIIHQDLPEKIDWQADPHGDPEWKYCLHRHEYLTELGRAYWFTGDIITEYLPRLLASTFDGNIDPFFAIPKLYFIGLEF